MREKFQNFDKPNERLNKTGFLLYNLLFYREYKGKTAVKIPSFTYFS